MGKEVYSFIEAVIWPIAMIVFAAIVPHPPTSVEGIGTKEEIAAVQKTVDSFDVLREDLENLRPDVVVIISPHAPIEPYVFAINASNPLRGNFGAFHIGKAFSLRNDLNLLDEIEYASSMNEISIHRYPSLMDHGALVPIHHLLKRINPHVLHLSFSLLSFQSHYAYGEMLGKVFENTDKRIAIIASGDLSHRLLPNSPAGYSPAAKFFDERLIESLGQGDLASILHLREENVHDAAECGLRSFLIMLGAIRDKKTNFQLLSYEYPFGIGYLVARFL